MFIDYLPSILALLGIQLVGVMSPGPDFAVVVRNSLIYSRKIGVITAIGVALGTMVHLTYILLGFGIIIVKTFWLFHLFKYLGASYLIYVGVKGLRARKEILDYGDIHQQKGIASLLAFRIGFLTNVLNAKCMLFFLSILSAFLTPKEPGMIIFIYGAIILFTTFIWFFIVALCFSHEHLRQFFSDLRHWIERVTGGFLMLLGIRMLFIEAESLS